MKNKDIITIVDALPGFLLATGHSLPVEHFYKFVKFKRGVQKAYEAITKAQRDFMREVGIEERDFSNPGTISKEKADRFNASNSALLDEDVEFECPAKIPMEYYKGFYDENKTDKGDIFANPLVENIILDNLFIENNEE